MDAQEAAEAGDQLRELAAAGLSGETSAACSSVRVPSNGGTGEAPPPAFDRLDPARRSLSAPSVQLLASGPSAKSRVVAPLKQLHSFSKRRQLQMRLRRATRPSGPADEQEESTATLALVKVSRRKTALGLIGGALGGSSGGGAANNQPAGQPQQATGGGGWRNWWFSNPAAQTNSANKQTTASNQQQQLVSSEQAQAVTSSVARMQQAKMVATETSKTSATSILGALLHQSSSGKQQSQTTSGDIGGGRQVEPSTRNSPPDFSHQQRSLASANPSCELRNQRTAQAQASGAPSLGDTLHVAQQVQEDGVQATNQRADDDDTRDMATMSKHSSTNLLTSAASSSASIVTICMAPPQADQNGLSAATTRPHQETSSNVIVQSAANTLQQSPDNVIEISSKQMEETQSSSASLVDLLIDSQLDWRQLICRANRRQSLSSELSERQIKRQEIIHELIQTERHHCLTLALMRQVYLTGLLKLNEQRQAGAKPTLNQHQDPSAQQVSLMEPVDLERLFPALDELIQTHELFFAHLRLRLVECCATKTSDCTTTSSLIGLIGPLGELLIEQFKLEHDQQQEQERASIRKAHNVSARRRRLTSSRRQQAKRGNAFSLQNNQQQQQPTNGAKLLQAYAKFCGQHNESSRYFKQLMQFDKGFRHFIEQCNKQHPACKQRGLPECNLLVAQRLTKYPLLIEQLIKTSAEEPNGEEAKLRRALAECRNLLAALNGQLARKESFERLLDIYAHFSPKSSTSFYHKQALKFTKHDLLQHKRLRQLLHLDDQVRLWSASRRKLFPVLCLILDDIIAFLRVEQAPQATSGGSGGGSAGLLLPVAASQHQAGAPNELTMDSHELKDLNSSLNLGAAESGASPHLQSGTSARYYFANVDNKSSVISLSKLLVREKAVEEAEPRVYLISSSPKQPEMYELAFVSRRHQRAFLDKLNASIEAHNQLKRRNSSLIQSMRNKLMPPLNAINLNSDSSARLSASQSSESLLSCCSSSLTAGRSQGAATTTSATSSPSGSVSSLSTANDELDHETCVCVTRALKTGDEFEDLELDIEQDLLEEPPGEQEETGHVEQHSSCSSSTISSTSVSGREIAGGQQEDEASRRPELEEGGQLELLKCANRQSGRATQGGPRRRRFCQRPRQVSNQSSSSDSGNSSGTANTTLDKVDLLEAKRCCETASADTATAGSPQTPPRSLEHAERDLDSGQGHDELTSGNSSSSSTAGGQDSLALASTSAEDELEDETTESPVQVGSSSTCTSSKSDQESSKELALGSLESQQSFSGPRVVLSKLARKCERANKMRKLSTVSSISNQAKLVQRLRSLGLLDTPHGNADGGAQLSPSYQSACQSLNCCQSTHPPDGSLGAGSCSSTQALLAANKCRQVRRRSLFIPEQKLEELRNLRIKLDKDKQEWQEKFDRMQEQLLTERRELDLAREKLKHDRQQVENEREQLFRKLDLLKENGILLSPSHKIIITAPSQQQYHSMQRHHHRQQQQIYSINQHQFELQHQQRLVTAMQQQQRQQFAAATGRVPLHLSQQSLAKHHQSFSHQQPHDVMQQQQQQPIQVQQPLQQQQQRQYKFIGALPGASFLVKRFGGGGGASGGLAQPTGQLDSSIIQAHI